MKIRLAENTYRLLLTAVLVLVVGGFISWNYSNQKSQKSPVSRQFKGTALEVRDANLALIGGYIDLGQNDPMVGGSKIVTVFFDGNTKIIKNTIKVEGDSGFAKPVELADQQQEITTIAELKSDLKEDNLVLTVGADDNIYNLDTFTAASIEYTVLIFR